MKLKFCYMVFFAKITTVLWWCAFFGCTHFLVTRIFLKHRTLFANQGITNQGLVPWNWCTLITNQGLVTWIWILQKWLFLEILWFWKILGSNLVYATCIHHDCSNILLWYSACRFLQGQKLEVVFPHFCSS